MRKNTFKKKNKKNISKKGGRKNAVDEFINLLPSISENFYIQFREQVEGNETTEEIIEKLESNLTMEYLTQEIYKIRKEANKDRKRNLLATKFSCKLTREVYHELIQTLIPEWKNLIDDNQFSNKSLAKGAHYIRWVSRVTVRELTEISRMLTRNFCDPVGLNERDQKKYGCTKGKICPPIDILIKKFKINNNNENDEKWLEIYNGSMRSNEDFDLGARLSASVVNLFGLDLTDELDFERYIEEDQSDIETHVQPISKRSLSKRPSSKKNSSKKSLSKRSSSKKKKIYR